MHLVHTSLKKGFALPTVLIASVVLLTVLVVAVTSTVAVRTTLKNQYYAQLAQVAGEAGVAYAKACLAASSNIPQWTDAKPLMPSTDCTGTALSGVTCPSAACYLTVNGNVRSLFKVGLPSLDGDGRAITVPNNGIVEVTRSSTGNVWRTFTQPAVQSAVVPDLCSGKATAALGWNPVVTSAPSSALPEAGARAIRIASGSINPGPMYFRKDFSVTEAGTYTLNIVGDDYSTTYIDGRMVTDWQTAGGYNTNASGTINLSVGCHTLAVQLVNAGIAANAGGLTLSLTRNGSSKALVVSDASWRVSAGSARHFSTVDYYVGTAWTAARDIQAWNATTPVWTTVPSPAWNTTSGDSSARWISTTHSYTSTATYPASTTIFRDKRNIRMTDQTDVKVSYACDDTCKIWMDGQVIAQKTTGAANVVNTVTINVPPGVHKFAVTLTNTSSSSSGFLFAAQQVSDATILTKSDSSWQAANSWFATDPDPSSYDMAYQPTPNFYDCSCDAQGATNLVANPSFETNLTGWSQYLGLNAPTRVSTNPATGSYRLSATGTSTTTWPRVSYIIPAKYGDIITVSGWVRSDGQTPTGTLLSLKTRYNNVEFYTGGGTGTWAPNAAGWSWVTKTITIPPGTDELLIAIGVSTAANYSGTLGVDGVIANYGTTQPNYADGNAAGWMWLGTTNASLSAGPLL